MRKFEQVIDKCKKHSEVTVLPERKTERSAGYDFVTPERIELKPNERSSMIFTDVKAGMEQDDVLMLYIRSSLGVKGLMLVNNVGVIDSDYYSNPDNDGNIGFMVHNFSDKTIVVEKGDRIVQGVFLKYQKIEEDNTTDKRVGGMGSTSK